MLRQTCIKKKRKKGSPVNVVTLVIAKPLFPTEGRWASERGKFRTSDLLWGPLLARHLPWHVVALNPPTDWEKESNFSRESPFQRSHYHSGLLVYLSRQHPHLSETCPLRSALGALFVLDEPTHMASTSQGKHSDPRRELTLPRYSLDVGHQNASWSLWSLKWCEAAVSICSQRWWMDGKT